MPKFTVEILSEKAFDRMARSEPRYAHVLDEDDPSLAFADPQKGRVFIRNTHWPEANRLLLHHELDHLVEEHGTDEDEFGIRHKRGFGHFALEAARQIAPFFGPVGGIGGQAAQNVLKGRSPGYNLLPGAVEGAITSLGGGNPAIMGLTRGAGSAASDAMTGRPGLAGRAFKTGLGATAAFTGLQGLQGGGFNPFGQFTTGANQTGANQVNVAAMRGLQPSESGTLTQLSRGLQQSAPGTSLTQGVARPSGLTGFLQSAGRGIGNFFGNIGGGLQNAFSSFTGGSPPPGGGGNNQTLSDLMERNIASGGFGRGNFNLNSMQQLMPGFGGSTSIGGGGINWGQVGLGTALSLGGNRFARTPNVPELGQVPELQQLRQNLGQPLSGVGKLGVADLTQRLNQQFTGLPPDVEAGIHRQFEVERRNQMAAFKQFQPGADLATNSRLRQVMQDIDQREAETVAQQALGYRQQFEGIRSQDISSALGVDQQTLESLMVLAQADIQTIATRLGISAQSANDFKNAFSQLGGAFVSRGLGLNQFNIPRG